jgi:hypothetical protein
MSRMLAITNKNDAYNQKVVDQQHIEQEIKSFKLDNYGKVINFYKTSLNIKSLHNHGTNFMISKDVKVEIREPGASNDSHDCRLLQCERSR